MAMVKYDNKFEAKKNKIWKKNKVDPHFKRQYVNQHKFS